MGHVYLNEHITFNYYVYANNIESFQVRTLEERLSGIVVYSCSRVQFYSKP